MAAGARLLAGGRYEGLFYQPTVLADVRPGMPTFEVKTPVGANQILMKQQIKEAIAEATSHNFEQLFGVQLPTLGAAA